MSDLDPREQNHVRAALHYLRIQLGGLKPVAKALQAKYKTLLNTTSGRNAVSASIALRVARLLDAPFDDLLAGRFRPGTCPKCGHKPSYIPGEVSHFGDESTVVESEPRPTAGLQLVK